MVFSGWVPPMTGRRTASLLGCGLVFLGALYAFQKPFRQLPGVEYFNFELTPDWQTPGEWAFARLMFPPGPNDGYAGRFDGDFRQGLSLWTQDYPRADRHFSQAVRRLTRLQTRSVEQPVMMEDGDEAFNWPWIYAVQVGEWGFTEAEAKVMREYLLRGGFFMCDDFHGTAPYRGVPEWEVFTASMSKVFPDRKIEDIPDNDPIFHTLFDLQERFQVPGAQFLESGLTYEDGETGKVPHWRCIRDDKGRIMVAICHNMDLGDAWEHADNPQYPEKYSSLAYRIAANYFVYDLTH